MHLDNLNRNICYKPLRAKKFYFKAARFQQWVLTTVLDPTGIPVQVHQFL